MSVHLGLGQRAESVELGGLHVGIRALGVRHHCLPRRGLGGVSDTAAAPESRTGGSMKKIAWTVAFVFLGLAAYLSLWPVPIRAVSWKAPAMPGYTGAHAVNRKLAGLNLIALGAEAGPEHIVLARDGKLYAAMASGNIV